VNNSLVQQIKDKLDIVDYVARFAPDLKKNGRYHKACCPFHSEKTPSFVVNADTQSWRCFGACAEGGDVFSFAMKRHNWSFSEAIIELGQLVGIDTRQERSPEKRDQDAKRDRLRDLLKTASEFYHHTLGTDNPDAQKTLAYLYGRGFSDETIIKFQMGYAPNGYDHLQKALDTLGYSQDDMLEVGLLSKNDKGRVYDRFRHRLMIPIRDERGHVVGFGARALNPDDNPKYLNSPQSLLFDKSKLLFGLDMAKSAIRETGMAIIVEGYMDAIQAHQAGYPNVVAQMGTAMTETQLGLLVPRYTHKIILALDADVAGQSATRRSLEVARQTLQKDYTGRINADIRILHIEDAKDPDDVLRQTPQLWQHYVDNAQPVADFVIALETQDLSPKATFQEKQALAERVLPILTASESSIYKKENVQKLALRLRIAESDLLAWADKLLANTRQNPAPKPAPPAPNIPNMANNAPYMPEEYTVNSEEPPVFVGDWQNDAHDFLPPNHYASNYEEEPSDLPLPRILSKAPNSTSANPTQLTTRHVSRRAEEICLGLVLQDFNFYILINSKFREILAEVPELKDHALTKLSLDDFSQTDLRLIMGMWLEATEQDEDPQDYIESHVEGALRAVWEQLQWGENDMVHEVVKYKMSSEMSDILKKLEKHQPSETEKNNQSLRRVIEVRENRLHRELSELRFLISDPSVDSALIKTLSITIRQLLKAVQCFQTSVKNLSLG
jgi:DNA primase